MAMKQKLLMVGAMLCIGVSSPASAQAVYKCASRGSVTYSEVPCSRKMVNTDQAPASVKPKKADARRLEQQRILAGAMRPRPGESAQQFETRRRRARLMPEDGAECARLDTRMPVEEASMSNPDRSEVLKAEAALEASRKRFRELRC